MVDQKLQLETLWRISVFASLFFISTTISNAGTSISVGLMLILTIYMYRRNHYDVPIPSTGFLYPYIIFFLLLFIATIPLMDAQSLHTVWKYFHWTLPFFLFYYAGCVNNFKSIVEKSMLCSMLFLSGCTLYLAATLPWGTRISGIANQPNLHAIVIESVLPYVIFLAVSCIKSKNYNKIMPWLAVVLSITGIASLLLTQSRGACAGFFAGFSFLVLLRIYRTKNIYLKSTTKKVCACVLLIAISVGGIFSQSDKLSRSYDHERILLWTSSYHMWQDHKLFGVGLANWKEAYDTKYILPESKEPNLAMPHNVFMAFLSQTGIIGFLGYLIFLFGEMTFIIKRIIRGYDNYLYHAMLWGLIAITVHGFVDTGIINRFAMQIFFSYAGITLAIDRLSRGNSRLVK